MSKLFRTLRELEEARTRISIPVCAEREKVSVSPAELKDLLFSSCASEKPQASERVSCTLEEFERLEKEFLDLQEKQKVVLLRIKEALNALEAIAIKGRQRQEPGHSPEPKHR